MDSNFNVSTNQEGVVEIRHGDALPLREQRILNISGVLSAPGDYYEQRKKLHEVRSEKFPEIFKTLEANKAFPNCVITVNSEAGTIELLSNQEDYYSTIVKGGLNYDKNFDKLEINRENTKKTLKSMAALIKRYKVFFKDTEKSKDVYMALLSQKARISKEVENSDDFKGNVKKYFERKLEGVDSIVFELNIPIFKGDIKRTFEVEIIFDVVNESIQCYLESPALFEIEYNLKEQLISEQIKRFDGEAVIYQ